MDMIMSTVKNSDEVKQEVFDFVAKTKTLSVAKKADMLYEAQADNIRHRHALHKVKGIVMDVLRDNVVKEKQLEEKDKEIGHLRDILEARPGEDKITYQSLAPPPIIIIGDDDELLREYLAKRSSHKGKQPEPGKIYSLSRKN